MNRNILTTLGLALAFSVGALAQGSSSPAAPPPGGTGSKAEAKAETKAEGKAETRPARNAGYPFRGKLKAVDLTAKTLTLAGREKDRVFHVTAETKFTKDGKPATLADGAKVEEAAGYARTGKDGRAEAVTVRLGPAPKDVKRTDEAEAQASTVPPAGRAR